MQAVLSLRCLRSLGAINDLVAAGAGSCGEPVQMGKQLVLAQKHPVIWQRI